MAPAVAWEEVTERDGAPKARSSHAVAVIGRKAYVFGGEFEPRVPIDNHVHVFDLDAKNWSIAPASGDIPGPRIGVTMVALENTLFVFAGRDAEHEELDEFYSFDTVSGEWKKLPSGPPHRSYHTLVADPSSSTLYTFGGCGRDGRLKDLWSFSTASNTWKAMPLPGDNVLPRGGPALAVAGGGVWVINGFNGKELGDVHRFDIASETWEEVHLTGDSKPSPRSVLCAVTYKCYIVIYGGEVDPSDQGHLGAGAFSDEVWLLCTKARSWIKPAVKEGGSVPGGRGWYSAAPVGENQMLVYGGNSATNDRLDDMHLLTVTA